MVTVDVSTDQLGRVLPVSALLGGCALVLAVGAAIRSTWSPCGLSMLSTLTPVGERARGNRFAVTAVWFVAGAVLGGLTLGLLGAALAGLVRASGLPASGALALGAVVSLLGAAVDAGTLGIRPPFLKRQVNDDWLREYRPWVYGVGFGWQIGVGLATYVMTAGVLGAMVLAAATTSPVLALAAGGGFGLVRGLAVFMSAGADDAASLRRVHLRFARSEQPVRLGVTSLQAAIGVLLATMLSPLVGLVGALACLVAVAWSARPPRRANVATPTVSFEQP